MELAAGVQWGDVPTWVEAIGTLLAFVIALVIFGRSVRDRRREQARRVSAWVPGAVAVIPPGMALAQSPMVAQTPTVQMTLKVKNGSDEMISDVRAEVVAADGATLGQEPVRWTDLGPGQEVELTSHLPDDGSVRGEVRLRVEFTDGAGRRWGRLGGSLRRIRTDL